MKKKILFGLGAIAIAVVLTFNASIAKNSNSSELSFNELGSTATAQAEDWSNRHCRFNYEYFRCMCYESDGAGSCAGICMYEGNYYCS